MLTILGGGPTGLSVAFYAQKAGVPFVLYEASDELGGLCRTLSNGAHRYDCGAHRLHDRDHEVTADIVELLRGQVHEVTVPSRIFDGGRFVDFPPTPLNFLRAAGVGKASRVLLELVAGRFSRTTPVSFADFSNRSFGKTLAKRFLLDYSEKVWGLPGDQLSPDVSTRRLKGMTLGSLFVELFRPKKKTSHIDGRFLYPKGGYGKIVDAIVHSLPAECLRTNHRVSGVELEHDELKRIHFLGRPPVDVDGYVVSTLPLPILVRLMGEIAPPRAVESAKGLRFRAIRLFFLCLSQPSFSRNASLYFPDPSLCFSRISEPKNRCSTMAPPHETSVLVEVPCFAGDRFWVLSEEDLLARVVSDLEKTGMFSRANLIEWKHHFLPDAYPVYSLDYAEKVKGILDSLDGIRNLETTGRNGLFFYSHLHDQFRMAKDYIGRFASQANQHVERQTA